MPRYQVTPTTTDRDIHIELARLLLDPEYRAAHEKRQRVMSRDFAHMHVDMAAYDFGTEESFLGYFAEVHAIWFGKLEEKYNLYERVGRAAGLDMGYLQDYQKSMVGKNWGSRSDVDRRQSFNMLMKDLWEAAVRFAEANKGVVTVSGKSKDMSWRAYEVALGSLGALVQQGGLSFYEYWIGEDGDTASSALAEAREHGFDSKEPLVVFPSGEEESSGKEEDESPEVVESPGMFSGSFTGGSK